MKRLLPVLILGIGVICFALALADQYASGTVYSEGSSLRNDRDGTSAYYEALQRIGNTVERSFTGYDSMDGTGATVMILHLNAMRMKDKDTVESLTRVARSGARVMIALDSGVFEPVQPGGWDLAIKPQPDQEDSDEENVEWPIYLDTGPAWHIFRSDEGLVLAAERTLGKGTLAIVAASHPFLNGALRDQRDIELLDWAAGTNHRILFDETHLGSSSSGNVMGLLRKMRLQSVLFTLAAASLLFFWRASIPFPPIPEPTSSAALKILSGTASQQALRNLLERRIPSSALLTTCVKEWIRDRGRRSGSQVVKGVNKAVATQGSSQEKWEIIRGLVRGANHL